MRSRKNALSEEFLYELYATVIRWDDICHVVSSHMRNEFLPDRDFQKLNSVIANHYATYKSAPSYAVLSQTFKDNPETLELVDSIREYDKDVNREVVVDMFEQYLKGVRLQSLYTEVGRLYNENKQDKAEKMLVEYGEWVNGFTLKENKFVDVIKTFSERFYENRRREEEQQKSGLPEVNYFYIPELDKLNDRRNLRGQLTCFLASTGVGKSHIAKYIGTKACYSGLNVLHFQLEGSEDEALNAYSGSMISKNAYFFEKGKISDWDFVRYEKMLDAYKGSVVVRSYPRFNMDVATLDIKGGIAEYRKLHGLNPDIVIIDSMDILTDAKRQQWHARYERSKRIAVANDLKDIANDENLWVVTTYQSTIENRDWLNNENNVLTEYNCSEAKGLARPCTHLISLNQTSDERQENLMRLHIAKSRFFKKGDTIKIATDYDNEVFYDIQRTETLL